MLENIAIGAVLVMTTTVNHAAAMVLAFDQLRAAHARRWVNRSRLTRVTVVALLVLFMFFASLIEVSMWAVTYMLVGALTEFEPALYFSMVTFTSLGYGDIVLGEEWRLLASFQAANGVIMFGWTTALIFSFVQRLYFGEVKANLGIE